MILHTLATVRQSMALSHVIYESILQQVFVWTTEVAWHIDSLSLST